MKSIPLKLRAVLVLLIVVASVGCDQATKHIATDRLKSSGKIEVAGKFFALQYAENEGAFLSLGATLPRAARFWIFTVFTSVVLVALTYYVFMSAELRGPDVVAIALLLSGGIGNMIDRIANDGIVVDFMVMEVWGPIRTGVFNVADLAVMVGVFLLFGARLFAPRKQEGEAAHGPTDT
ncbi:MAG: signal peptidase II [Candidatus Hydrogenedentes bacterium]|nr:signal peptidase II [Candidatus Hydrogenedentota bacterium]